MTDGGIASSNKTVRSGRWMPLECVKFVWGYGVLDECDHLFISCIKDFFFAHLVVSFVDTDLNEEALRRLA